MHIVCSLLFILKVQVIQLFSISFILPRFLPNSIYKLIPYSIQFRNLSSQSFPNYQHRVTSNRSTPCKKFPYLLIIHNISNLQDSKIHISDFILESFSQFHTIPIFSLGPNNVANIPIPKR